MMVKLIARFVNAHTGKAMVDPDVGARIYDRDPVSDEFLAESRLSADGEAEWLFSLSAAGSLDSPGERRPDIYVELEKAGAVFFQTPVKFNMDFDTRDPVSGESRGQTRFLGVFHVDSPEP